MTTCKEFERRHRGPFTIKERINIVAYSLELPPAKSYYEVSHVFAFVPHRPRDSNTATKEAAAN